MNLLLVTYNTIDYIADTFWTLLFCIFSFYYLIKTVLFELICFSQYFNDRQNKLNTDLLVFCENESVEKKNLYLNSLFLMLFLA